MVLAAEKRLCILPVLIGQRISTFAASSNNGVLPKFDFAEFGGHKFPTNASRTSAVTFIALLRAVILIPVAKVILVPLLG